MFTSSIIVSSSVRKYENYGAVPRDKTFIIKISVQSRRSKFGVRTNLLVSMSQELLDRLGWKVSDSIAMKNFEDLTVVEFRKSKNKGYPISDKNYILIPLKKGLFISDIDPIYMIDFSKITVKDGSVVIDYGAFLKSQ